MCSINCCSTEYCKCCNSIARCCNDRFFFEKSKKDQYQIGDILGIKSEKIMIHYGLYVGLGRVIHLVTRNGGSYAALGSGSEDEGFVYCDTLETFARCKTSETKLKIAVFNGKKIPLPEKEILREAANSLLGKKPFCITTDNCRNFVETLRFGPHQENLAEATTNQI